MGKLICIPIYGFIRLRFGSTLGSAASSIIHARSRSVHAMMIGFTSKSSPTVSFSSSLPVVVVVVVFEDLRYCLSFASFFIIFFELALVIFFST